MTAKILINRKQCQIIDEYDLEFVNKLRRQMSFFVQGTEYTKLYRGYRDKDGKEHAWDGNRNLITNTLKFAPGLLERVLKVYQVCDKSVEIIDIRPEPELASPIDIIPKLQQQGKTPFYYQTEAIDIAIQKSRGIIRLPTGSGKTIVSALLVSKLGKSTIVYVIGKDLLYQIHKLFSSLFDEPIGIIGDGKCEIADINIATIWSVGQAFGCKKRAEEEESEKNIAPEKYKAIRNMLANTRVHIFDECHLAACETIQGICKRMNPENVYGMSASPWRDDGADLLVENYLGNVIVNVSAQKLIQEGYLVPPLIKFIPVPKVNLSGKYQTVYKKYVTENDIRNKMIVTGAIKLVEQGFQTLVLFNSLKHGDILHEEISAHMPCALLSGKDNNTARQKVKDDLESGKTNCVIASRIFDIGVDLPSLSGLIVAGAGKSSVRALQRVGRVIRRHPGKERAAVIDFADQTKFLLNHSEARRKIYAEEFDVIWPDTR